MSLDPDVQVNCEHCGANNWKAEYKDNVDQVDTDDLFIILYLTCHDCGRRGWADLVKKGVLNVIG